jgi:putative ABC transport system permease protein
MNLTRLAIKDIRANSFRSWVVVLCALLIGALALASVLIARGADQSLSLAEQRTGADIVVVKKGAEQSAGGALLMGTPLKTWIPSGAVQRVASVPGVDAVSPQLFLASSRDSPDSDAPLVYLVAYDPATDFTLRPWLSASAPADLGLDEVVAGSGIHPVSGTDLITLYGHRLSLKTNLEPTGTNLDQTLFVTFKTAALLKQLPDLQKAQGFAVPDDSISSVLVRVTPGADARAVAADIQRAIPGVGSVASPDLFRTLQDQLAGQRASMIAVLAVVLALALAVLVIVFSMIANERRREIGVMRALGATRGTVLRSLLTGAAVLALSGGVAGVILSTIVILALRERLAELLGSPFTFPSASSFGLILLVGLGAAVLGVLLGAFFPAYRISRQEPAISMRE